MKCPICETEDYIQFVFVLHHDDKGIVSKENPSDCHWLYLCPKLHVYNEDGNTVTPISIT